MKEKVTILSPVYNGETYLARYLDSVLRQDYRPLEFILVDDGSTDNTAQIIQDYEDKFALSGIEWKHVRQENRGQAAAINTGLKEVTGTYLTWPDSDDILMEQSITKRVSFLKNHPKYRWVRCEALVYQENDLTKLAGRLKRKEQNNSKTDLFYDFIFENDIYFAPGCYMVYTSTLKEVLPEFQIYETRGGQNWQLYLPIALKYPCGYMPEALFTYIVRSNSHSHSSIGDYQKLQKRYTNNYDILTHVLESLSFPEKEKILLELEIKYQRMHLSLALQFRDTKRYESLYQELSKKDVLTRSEKICHQLGGKSLARFYLKMRKLFHNLIHFPIKILRKVQKKHGY